MSWRSIIAALTLLASSLVVSCDAEDGGGGGDRVTCDAPAADAVRFPETKLYFEHNFTDGDTGIHSLLDASGWSRLCLYDPGGEQILGVRPMGSLGRLGLGAVLFESREPKHGEITVEDHLAVFPAGSYEVRGTTHDGKTMTGTATLTHDIPAAPVITAPADGSTIPPSGLTVTWEPVTETIGGGAVTISGYQVIVTNEEADDPHGYSVPVYDVHVPPAVTSLPVPGVFLEAGTVYEVEVLALETSGNQTISAIFFTTE